MTKRRNSVTSYIANLGKSVSYAAVDKFKEMNPTIGSFTETNQELFKTVYSDIRNYKTTYKKTKDVFQSSKVYEASDLMIKSIFEDIKSGKLYNQDRKNEINSQVTMGMTDMGFDDSDVNTDLNWDDMDSSQDDSLVSRAIKQSNQDNANAVSNAVARTGQYIVESNKSSNNILYAQNAQAYSLFNTKLGAINDNLSNIVDFSSNVIQVNAENAKKYYEKTTQLMEEQIKLLQGISQAVVPQQQQDKRKKKIGVSDVLDSEGALDIKEYMKNIKKNLSNMDGGMGGILNSFGEDSNPLMAFVSSPLEFIPKYLVAQMIPSMVAKRTKDFDKSLSGFFGSMIAKFNTMSDDDNILKSKIGEIFGVRNRNKSSLDTNRYNKEKVDWNGKAQKALVEVIPTQLSKIVSLLSGKSEKIYDYESGKFVDSKDIKKQFENENKRYVDSATFDVKDEFEKLEKLITFQSQQEHEKWQKDRDQIFKTMFDSGKLFKVNSKTPDSDYSNYGVDQKNYKIFKKFFSSLPKNMQLQLNREILYGREQKTKRMQDYEDSGTSIYNHLFNNSNFGEFIKENKHNKDKNESLSIMTKNNLKNTLDNKGHNIFYYLQNMYKELQFMRMYGKPGASSDNLNPVRIMNSNGESARSIPSINDMKIKNESIDDKEATNRFNKKQNENKRYLENEKKRTSKKKPGHRIVNVSKFDDKDLENELSTSLDLLDKQKLVDHVSNPNNLTYIDKLLQARSVAGKAGVVMNTLTSMSKKPMDFFINVLNKVDKRMYEVIYGNPEEKGQEKGFMGVMIGKVKSMFTNLNDWLDEKILNPLKQKLQVENFKELGDKFLGIFGINRKDLKEKIHDFFLGDNGLLTTTKEAIKNTFSKAWDTVKESTKSVFGPIFSKFKIQGKKKSTGNKDLDKALGLDNESLIPISKKQKQGVRRRGLDKHIAQAAFNPEGASQEELMNYINNYGSSNPNAIHDLNDMQTILSQYHKDLPNINASKALLRDKKNKFAEIQSNYYSTRGEKSKRKFREKYDPNGLKLEIESMEQKIRQDESAKDLLPEYVSKKNEHDIYNKSGNVLFTKGLANILGMKDTKSLSNFVSKAINDNKNNPNKNIESLSMEDLLSAINGTKFITNKDMEMQKNLEAYSKKFHKGTPLLEMLQNPNGHTDLPKGMSISDIKENYPGFVNGAIGGKGVDSSENLLSKISSSVDTIKEKISGLYDKLISSFGGDKDGFNPLKTGVPKIFKPLSGWNENDKNLFKEKKTVEKFSGDLSKFIAQYIFGNINPHAKGSNGIVDKTQVTTLSEGEMVLPKDKVDALKNIFEDIIKGTTSKDKKKNKDIANEISDKYYNYKDIDNSNEDPTTLLQQLQERHPKLFEKLNSLSDKDKKNVYHVGNMVDEKLEIYNRESKYIEAKVSPFISEVGAELKNGAQKATEALFGADPEKQSKAFRNTVQDVTSNISTYAPEAIGGGLLGAGVSLVTGAIGGPLLGAAAGAGISLVKNSEKAQQWLFGETIDGERQGGLISKNTIKTCKKYFPDLQKYGIAGGVAGLVPFLPFGPVGGLLMGSAYSVVKNNSEIQHTLFGDTGLISNKTKDKFKKALPKAAAGAVIGALTGPFGLLGNTMVGSAVGLASSTDKFKELLLGKYNEKTKKYENGILSTIRDVLIVPMKKGLKTMGQSVMDFLKKDILSPLKDFLSPIKNEVKHGIKGVAKFTGMAIDWLTEKAFGIPLSKIISDKFGKVAKAAKGAVKFVGKSAKNIISAPFKGLGWIGNKRRAHQIAKGYAYDMSAEEQLEFRKNHKVKDTDTRNINMFVKNLTKEGLDETVDNLNSVQNTKDHFKKKRRDILYNISNDDNMSNYDHTVLKNINKNVREGNVTDAAKAAGINTNNDKTSFISKMGSSISSIGDENKKLFNNAKKILKDNINDKAVYNKAVRLVKNEDIKSLTKLLKETVPDKAATLIPQLNDEYFSKINKNKINTIKGYSDISSNIGDLTSRSDINDKIMEQVRSGNYDLAEKMMGVTLNHQDSSNLKDQASAHFNKYQSAKESMNSSMDSLDKILNQTFDKSQKKLILNYIKSGDQTAMYQYMSSLNPDIRNKLLEQMDSHITNVNYHKDTMKQSKSDLNSLLSENGYHLDQKMMMKHFMKKGNIDALLNDLDPSLAKDKSLDEKLQILELLNKSSKDYGEAVKNEAYINENSQDMYDKLSKSLNINVNKKNAGKILEMVKNEQENFKDKHKSAYENKPEDSKVTEEVMDMNETYHHDVISIITKAADSIEHLSKILDPSYSPFHNRDLVNNSKDAATGKEAYHAYVDSKEEIANSSTESNLDTTTGKYDNFKERNKKNFTEVRKWNKIAAGKTAHKANELMGPKKEQDVVNETAQTIAEDLNKTVHAHAKGGLIDKTQLSTLSRGEVVFTAENTSKLLSLLDKSVSFFIKKGNGKSTDESDTKTVTDTKGNVVEYVKNTDGELVPNMADSSTKKAIENAKKEDAQNDTLLGKIGKMLGRNKKDDDDDKKKKKKGGLLSKLLGGLGLAGGLIGKLFGKIGGGLGKLGGGLFGKLGGGLLGRFLGKGIFGKVLGIGGTLLALPQIIKFTKDVAIPVMSDVYQNSFKPWLTNDAVPWLKEKGVPFLMNSLKVAARELPGLIASALKFAITDLIPTLLKGIASIFGLGGGGDYHVDAKDEAKRVGGAVVRHIATGGRTSNAILKNMGKKDAEKFAKKGIIGKIGHTIMHPIKTAKMAAGRGAVNGVEKSAGLVERGHEKLTNKLRAKFGVTPEDVERNGGPYAESYKKMMNGETAKDAAKEGTEEAAKKTAKRTMYDAGKAELEAFSKKSFIGKAIQATLHPIKTTKSFLKVGMGKGINAGKDKIVNSSLAEKIKAKGAAFAETKTGKVVNAAVHPIETGKKGLAALATKAKDTGSSLIGALKNKFKEKPIKYDTKKTGLLNKTMKAGGTLVEQFTNNIKSFLHKLLNNETVAKILGSDAVKKLSESFVPKILKAITENVAKKGVEITGKILAATSTGGILNVIWAAADFVSGYNNAQEILSITKEPTFGMKICAGFIKALNGLFMITSFIPEKLWVNLMLDIVLPIFGVKDLDIQKERAKAQKDLDAYNKKNGTNLSMDDYNKKMKDEKNKKDGKKGLWANIKDGFKSAGEYMVKLGSKIGKGMVDAKNYLVDKGKAVVDWTKQTYQNLKQSALDIWNNLTGKPKQAPAQQGAPAPQGGNGGFGPGDGNTGLIPARRNNPKNENTRCGGFGPGNIIPVKKSKAYNGGFGPDEPQPTPEANASQGKIINGMVYYSQGDPRWGGNPYGSHGTLKSSACGPTSMAMVLSSLTGKAITPVDTAQWSVDHKYRVDAGTSWAFFNAIGKQYGIDMKEVEPSNKGAITEALKNKQPVIFSGQGPHPFSRGGHFIVGAGMEGDKILIDDPVSAERSKAYPSSLIFDHMRQAWISGKTLDGKTVAAGATQGSTGVPGAPGTVGPDGQPVAPEKPTIATMFEDFGGMFKNAMNRFYGFEPEAAPGTPGAPGAVDAQGNPINGGPSTGKESNQLFQFIKNQEGYKDHLYYDSGGTPTIGYGSTHGWIMQKSTCTEAEAEKALHEEVDEVANALEKNLQKKNIKLNQHQFDALVDFGYNLGIGGLLKSSLYEMICSGSATPEQITAKFGEYVHDKEGHRLGGLVKRRAEEAQMFNSGATAGYSSAGGNGEGGFGPGEGKPSKLKSIIKSPLVNVTKTLQGLTSNKSLTSNTGIIKTAPSISTKKYIGTKPSQNTTPISTSVSNDKILMTIINILMKIANNTSALDRIIEILGEMLTEKGDKESIKKLNKIKGSSKDANQQLANIVKEGSKGNNGSLNNSYLLSALEALASE